MSYNLAPFFPLYTPNAGTGAGALSASVTFTASNAAATAATALPGTVGTYNAMQQIQIANTTTSWIYVNFGQLPTNTALATVAAGYPVAPGAVVIVTVPNEVSAASVIAGSAPGTLTAVIFTRGQGT